MTEKTQLPEDFALTILDNLMERSDLTVQQLLTAASAYATAGLAQATRGEVFTFEEGELSSTFPAIPVEETEFIVPANYVQRWFYGKVFWVDPKASNDKLLESVREWKSVEKEEEELEHVEIVDQNGASVLPMAMWEEDIYTKEPTKELPMTLRESIEAAIAKKAEENNVQG